MKPISQAGPLWSGFFIALALGLASCQSPTPPAFAKSQKAEGLLEKRKPAKVTNGPTRSYLGLTKKEALARGRAMGLRTRILREDLESFPITKDLRQDRINFEIDKGRVTLAKIF